MFDDNLHFGVIRKTPILLFEAEMCGVKVEDKRWRTFGVLLEDVICRFHFRIAGVSKQG